MSWQSSAPYYRPVNEQVRERLGGLHSARCRPAEVAAGLKAGGAELIVLCTNTMHRWPIRFAAGSISRSITWPTVSRLGIVNDSSRVIYQRMIERLAAREARGVILGCTEIELLVTEKGSPVPFPRTRLHVEVPIAWSLVRAT